MHKVHLHDNTHAWRLSICAFSIPRHLFLDCLPKRVTQARGRKMASQFVMLFNNRYSTLHLDFLEAVQIERAPVKIYWALQRRDIHKDRQHKGDVKKGEKGRGKWGVIQHKSAYGNVSSKGGMCCVRATIELINHSFSLSIFKKCCHMHHLFFLLYVKFKHVIEANYTQRYNIETWDDLLCSELGIKPEQEVLFGTFLGTFNALWVFSCLKSGPQLSCY